MKLYIGENLKRLRNEKSITQDTLAEYLGVTYQAVSRWENGQAYPDIELLPELARFFEVSLEELMGTESDKERIQNTINESWDLLCEGRREEGLSKLRELEKEYPNDWQIKMSICYTLVLERDPPFDDVLPELRRYAFRAREDMKDYHYKMAIAEIMINAVPKEELTEWSEYVSNSLWSTRDRALYDRYLLWKQWDKAAEKESEILLKYIDFLTHFHNLTGTAEGNIAPSARGIRLIDALVGTPYRKGDHIENSILLGRREMLQTFLSFGYAGSGEEERGLDELEKAVDLCILWCDALKEDYFTSEYSYLTPQKNDAEDKSQSINWLIERMTMPHGCEWFDPIRNDPRYTAQLDRLLEKKAEMEEYWKNKACKAE